MGAAGFLALLGFVLFNIAQHTPFHLSEFQQMVLMVFTLLSVVKFLEELFPKGLGTLAQPPRRKVVKQRTIPPYGTSNGQGNPDAGKAEHNTYGV